MSQSPAWQFKTVRADAHILVPSLTYASSRAIVHPRGPLALALTRPRRRMPSHRHPRSRSLACPLRVPLSSLSHARVLALVLAPAPRMHTHTRVHSCTIAVAVAVPHARDLAVTITVTVFVSMPVEAATPASSNAARKPSAAVKHSFPDVRLPYLLQKIMELTTSNLVVLVDTVYQDVKRYKAFFYLKVPSY